MSQDYDGPMSCAVCASHLLKMSTSDHKEVEYVHPPSVVDDHIVVPVRGDEVQTEHRCDFCQAADPTWVMHSDFAGIEVQGQAQWTLSSGDTGWAGCPECKTAIERNDWRNVERRTLDYMARTNQLSAEEVEQMRPTLRMILRSVRNSRHTGFQPISPI